MAECVAPTLLQRSRLVAAVILAGLMLVGCVDDAVTAPLTGPVEIVLHLDDIERWDATGPLVDGDDFCPSGRRHLLGVYDAETGEEVSRQEYQYMFDDLVSPSDRPDVVLLNEHVCDDGSGTFVAAENQHRGDWEVRSGTGQYSGWSGTGTASFVVDLRANPSVVYVAAELTSPQ